MLERASSSRGCRSARSTSVERRRLCMGCPCRRGTRRDPHSRRRHGGRAPSRSARGHPHHVRIDETDVVTFAGLPVSSVCRTWCDLAASGLRLGELVAAGDRIIWRRSPTGTREELGLAVSRYESRRGIRSLRAALELLSHLSDSATESELRVAILLAGFPQPLINVEVRVGGRESIRTSVGPTAVSRSSTRAITTVRTEISGTATSEGTEVTPRAAGLCIGPRSRTIATRTTCFCGWREESLGRAESTRAPPPSALKVLATPYFRGKGQPMRPAISGPPSWIGSPGSPIRYAPSSASSAGRSGRDRRCPG